MKITRLRFKNLNSLVGEWSIDFTAPEYLSDGIFAIIGPTGAGKSTILDAICLALYGRTPRLSSISAKANEIMSRHTGECFAEVVFETNEGRFKAFWSQHRARGKGNGALQHPKRELFDLGMEKLLSSQIKATGELIEEKTGMDFNRFVQSMMLAQGGFAAFLQASGNERAPMLEQITGTEIYSNISSFVYEKNKEERIKLEKLQAENKGIVILNEEEEELIVKEKEERAKNRKLIAEQKTRLDAALAWLKNIAALENELAEIEDEEKLLSQELTAFRPKKQQLDHALRAATLDGEYADLNALRKQQQEELEAQKKIHELLPDLLKKSETNKDLLEKTEKEFNEKTEKWNKFLELAKKVRALDQDIQQHNKSKTTIEKQVKVLNGQKEQESEKEKGIVKSIAIKEEEQSTVKEYLSDHRKDEGLTAEFLGIKEKIQVWLDVVKEQSLLEKKLRQTKQELEDKKKEIITTDEALKREQEEHQIQMKERSVQELKIKDLLAGKTQEEILNRKDQLILYIAGLKKISDFDEERKKLTDGQACPLCGSEHHPWAEGNIPQPDEAEKEMAQLIQRLDSLKKLQDELKKLEQEEKSITERILKLNTQKDLHLANQKYKEKEVNELKGTYDKHEDKVHALTEALNQQLAKYGIQAVSVSEQTGEIIDILGNRKEQWMFHEKKQRELTEYINAQNSELKICRAAIKTRDEQLKTESAKLDDVQKTLASIKSQRIALFGEKEVDAVERKLKDDLEGGETQKGLAQQQFQQAQQALAENKILLSDLQTKTVKRKNQLDKAENNFLALLSECKFADEEEFMSFRIPAVERETLNKQSKVLEKKTTGLEERKKDRIKSLSIEKAKKLTNESPEKLRRDQEETGQKLEGITQEIGALNEKIKANEEAKKRGAEIRQRIEKQQAVAERWNQLNVLIGSADGKKYRNFAQGLTLEVMVSFANNQLAKLSDRYLLIRDKEEPLDLNVIDNYQAGEVRSTKNLSGGESFIVSLALALGLSQMSSRKMRVDSLFLDEGFGTLDEDTLETALGTLANLQQEGKMIGIISHVGALKDRINTKISVQQVREGKSEISGPGCEQL